MEKSSSREQLHSRRSHEKAKMRVEREEAMLEKILAVQF